MDLKEKMEDARFLAEEKLRQAKAAAGPKLAEVKEAAEPKLAELKEAADEKFAAAKELADEHFSERKDAALDRAGDLAESTKEKIEGAASKAKEKADDIKDDLDEGFNTPDESRDAFMLKGELADNGYDWWWHSFTGINKETGDERAFFIEFFTINPALGGPEPILGQDPANKAAGKKPSYMMVKAGAWGKDGAQLHRFFGWDEVTIKDQIPFLISADNCFLSETRTLGRVKVTEEEAADPARMCDAGEMIWDLNIDKQIAFNVGYGASHAMRDLDAFEMFWHAQGMKTAYSGKVIFNGEEYEISPETSYGYADKNWGKDFTSPWIWLSSNNMVSNISGRRLTNSVFDIGGGRPVVKRIGAIDNVLLGALYYEGTPYEFNFSKAWKLPKTQFRCTVGEKNVIWKVIQETPLHKMYVEVTCRKKDMLLVNYEAPDGSKKHNQLYNGGTGEGNIKLYKKNLIHPEELELIDDITIQNVGCEYGEYGEE